MENVEGSVATLETAIRQFELKVAGVQAWTPYWINLDMPPFRLNTPLRGKGSAAQLTEAVEGVLARTGFDGTAEGVRQRMREAGLGIDCAGFVYQVVDSVMAAAGRRLADQLTIPKSYVEAAIERYPERRRPELAELAEAVPLGWLCDLWDKAAVDLVNVKRLRDHSDIITAMSEVRAGDLVGWIGQPDVPADDHIGIVTAVDPAELVYWSSDNVNAAGEFGGVIEHRLPLSSPGGRVNDQGWALSKNRPTEFWRLRNGEVA